MRIRPSAAMIGFVLGLAGISHGLAFPFELRRESKVETLLSLGIQWDFGDAVPQAVVGIRSTTTSAEDAVAGGKLDLTLPLDFKAKFQPIIRAMGVAGNRDVQGEAGFGMKPESGQFLLGAGLQGPYVNGGANYLIGKGVNPYFGVNSIGRATGPTIITPTVC